MWSVTQSKAKPTDPLPVFHSSLRLMNSFKSDSLTLTVRSPIAVDFKYPFRIHERTVQIETLNLSATSL